MTREAISLLAGLALATGLVGCRVHVDKDANGEDKTVQVDTPFGGVHVNTNQTTAADLGMAEVVHCYALVDLLTKLLEVLQQEADERPERTAAATARAVKLQSIVALLGGGR